MTSFLEFWGKARPPNEAGARAHPLAWHSLDVAAVLERLLALRAFADAVPRGWHRPLVFLAALHDVGKFTRPFQALASEHWPASLGACRGRVGAPRHDTLGWLILSDVRINRVAPFFPGWKPRQLDPLLRATTGHHGRPPENVAGLLWPEVFCESCERALGEFIAAVAALLDPPAIEAPKAAEANRVSWIVAGLVNLADWIGSAVPPFAYVGAEDVGDVGAYWELARRRAEAAVAARRLEGAHVAPAGGMRALFPDIAPSPMQEWAERVALPSGPALVLIEDATGSGKTEAALVLAHRMMADERAGGLFFALPTTATTDAMFARLGMSYRRLFAPGEAPSLVLAHGRVALHEGFRASVLTDAPPMDEIGEDAAGPACAAWIADDRRKAFLAEIGAGTIDQALLAALPNKYAALRLLGLSRRVLIVDEAHAYDPYMQAELRALLRFQAALGGSAIVLSATLPRAMRRALVDAFAPGRGEELVETGYPLATVVGAADASEHPVAPRASTVRSVPVRRLADAAEAVGAIAAAASRGAAVAWIRNTVDDAIAATEALCELGVDATLFHARFAMWDRMAIEADVLARFGKESGALRRGVVVATQVIEQSLDLDFDLLVTDLAPIELLVQRAGRLWRHKRKRKDRKLASPELLVLSPEPVADPAGDWLSSMLIGTERVYGDPALLWRSARALFAAGAIATPDGVRALIEPVYAEGAEVPARLERRADKAKGDDIAAGRLGEYTVLKPADGYCRMNDSWEDDVRTPTRLSEGTVTVRLARLDNGRVVPWAPATETARAWALSEVSVRAHRLGTAEPAGAVGEAVARVKASWPVYLRGMPVVVLSPVDHGWWEAQATPAKGPPIVIRYRADMGLRFPSPP